eukprot:CAMPEP_0113533434 /NCGR_PEP_ID=MMETSP0015_2-20120614/4604_1 /TAXON_ID=2838 /ORGANISM="Odontella" /LENGTH=31 /DNA_ID=CAMNT_0000432489 /DNA_START=241 /DNA_END=336 /DNA_ORIENTATION=- /assembly_acc=CAM_ASM_000160
MASTGASFPDSLLALAFAEGWMSGLGKVDPP